MIVTLTREEALVDDQEAVRDHDRAMASGWMHVGWMPPGGERERLAYRIRAYRSEHAAAKFLGLADWRRDPNGFGKPDVGGYSVRLASRRGYGLMTYEKDDAELPYMLVEDQGDALSFRIVGVLPREIAQVYKKRGIGRQLGNAWLIPASELMALDGVGPSVGD